MKNVLEKMVEQLSEEDKLVFQQLASQLKENDGDVSKLSEDELSLIKVMESKYSDKLAQINQDEEPDSNIENIQKTNSIDLLETGFASFARQLLARDLKVQFPNEEDAVRFAFQNKWLPQDFKEPDTVLKIFEDYKEDISEANQWRDEVVGIESDKSMAVGMTWFMILFQLNSRLN